MDIGHLVGLMLDEHREPLRVCALDADVSSALGSIATDVLLSFETIQKQMQNHSDLTPEDYKALPLAIRFGEIRMQEERRALILYTDIVLNMNFRSVLKATKCGREVYCVSFNKLRDRHLKKDLRKPYAIIRPHD